MELRLGSIRSIWLQLSIKLMSILLTGVAVLDEKCTKILHLVLQYSTFRPKSVPPKYGFGMSPESMLMKAAFSADSGIGRLQGSFGNGRVNRNSYRPRNPNHRHREEERPPVSSNTTNGNQQRAVIDLNEPWVRNLKNIFV